MTDSTFKFKAKKDSAKVEVFQHGESIGALDRITNIVTAKYCQKPRYIYSFLHSTGERKIFDSRKEAALYLQSIKSK